MLPADKPTASNPGDLVNIYISLLVISNSTFPVRDQITTPDLILPSNIIYLPRRHGAR